LKNILKQASSLILPITVLILVPRSIESNFNFSLNIVSAIGLALVLAGLIILCINISTFIRFGKGTLAPWSPTKKLVVRGMYAHVRNPMITGVLTVLLGESLLFHSKNIFTWFVLFFIINYVYFILSEEPGLEKRFGAEYLEYKRNVPRWIPRLKPWIPEEESPS